jgi:hypothetical protein
MFANLQQQVFNKGGVMPPLLVWAGLQPVNNDLAGIVLWFEKNGETAL